MLQNIVVTAIISIAFLHVLWRWMPKGLKRRSAIKLSQLAARFNLSTIASWSNKKSLSNGCGDGCSSCNNCGPVDSTPKESVERTINIRLKSY